jgi:hypothetical protein
MKNLATALVKAQKAFSPALKNNTNTHFKNRYADLASCVDAVMDALNDNGIALIQKSYDCANGVMVETIFMHESGEIYEAGILQFPASKNDPQGYMSALTYARRGSLMAACGIAPEDDDGNAASRAPKYKMEVEVFNGYLVAIETADTLDNLKLHFATALKACGTDAKMKAEIIAAKDVRKAGL